MSGILAALSGGVFFSILGIANDGAGEYGYSLASFAGMAGTLSLKNLRGKTIDGITWNINASGHVRLYLDGTSVANTDVTFASVKLGSATVLARSSASYTANDGAGHTLWTWTANTAGYPTSSNVNVLIR